MKSGVRQPLSSKKASLITQKKLKNKLALCVSFACETSFTRILTVLEQPYVGDYASKPIECSVYCFHEEILMVYFLNVLSVLYAAGF